MPDPGGDRIHQALDGEVDAGELSATEERELTRTVFAVGEAGARLRRLQSPGLGDSVLTEIHHRRAATVADGDEGGGRDKGGGGWTRALFTPRTVSVRPIWGLLAAAALAALILIPMDGTPPRAAVPGQSDVEGTAARGEGTTMGVFGDASTGAAGVTAETEGVTVFVQFRLHAPAASDVRLAGTFTDWEPVHQLHPAPDGSWSILIPMNPGIHDYAFVVDGTDWKPDPAAPMVDDGFGGQNSRLALLLGNGARES